MPERVLRDETLYPGDTVRLSMFVVNPTDGTTLVDPTALVVKVKNPAAVTTTYTYGVGTNIVRTTTGTYYIDISVTTSGAWYVQQASTTPTDVAEYWFDVTETKFT